MSKNILIIFVAMLVFPWTPLSYADSDDLKNLTDRIAGLKQEQSRSFNEYQKQIEELEGQIRGPGNGAVEARLKSPEVSPALKKGFIDFNWYYDIEKFSVMTVNAGAQLTDEWSYFSLTNFSNDFGDGDYTDFVDFYSEQNITWSPMETAPFAWNIQWNLRSGDNNDRLRLAPQWLAHQTPGLEDWFERLNLTYTINFHVLQWDDETHGDYSWQLEHVYRLKVFPGWFDDRVYLAGYFDHSFGGPDNPAVVMDHQIGVRIYDQWYAIAEYRRNDYRRGKEDNLGLGVEYKIIFG